MSRPNAPWYLQSVSEVMSRELDPSWVALVDETIRRKVAAGDADQEILDAMAMMPFFSVPRGIKPSRFLPKWQHIETHLALLRLHAAEAEAPDEPPREAHGLTERQIREAAAAVRADVDGHPTRVRVAERLRTTEVTVKRAMKDCQSAMKDLRMGRWPPAPPEDGPDLT